MSETTYYIAISESERTAIAKVLGALVTKFTNASPQIENSQSPSTAPPAAVPPRSLPTAPHDRWARGKDGKEVPSPEGAEMQTVRIWKAEQRESKDKTSKFLKVTWYAPDGKGYVDANCFDAHLWSYIITGAGKEVPLHVVRNGKYLNIVGVRV